MKNPQKRSLIGVCALSAILAGLLVGQGFLSVHAQTVTSPLYNNFDVSNATIPKEAIRKGGPPRDGIPAILEPQFEVASDATWMREGDVIIGVEDNGVAKAYPLRILVWHELVNDELNGKSVLITYCPLCGTAMVFGRSIGGQDLTFGVSGLLFQSDVLMYDHQTESLWSQLEMSAVSGPMVETPLTWLQSHQMTWAKWKQQHPETLVLSRETGHRRDYSGDPYEGYSKTQQVMFPVPKLRDELARKEWVLGVIVDGTPKAYSIADLKSEKSVIDEVNGAQLRIDWDEEGDHANVRAGDETLPSVRVFWFAWQAFYPDTLLYTGQG